VFSVAIEEWLKVHELEETTREGYEMYARKYINPALGDEPISKISAVPSTSFARRGRVRFPSATHSLTYIFRAGFRS
jgi:hypothetical protein